MPLLSLLRTVDDIAGILVSKITIFVSYMSKMIAAPVSHSSAFGNLLCPLFRYACITVGVYIQYCILVIFVHTLKFQYDLCNCWVVHLHRLLSDMLWCIGMIG